MDIALNVVDRSVNGVKRTSQNRSGAAYVIALVTLLVGATLSLALLRASGGQFTLEISRQNKQAAVNLAEAGVDYARWQVVNKKHLLPYSADVSLNTGSFHVDAVDDSSRQMGEILITATGTSQGCSYTMKRVIGSGGELLNYLYFMCSNADIDLPFSGTYTQTESSLSYGFRSNGNVTLASCQVNNGVWATGTITTNGGSVAPLNPGSDRVIFPNIDFDHYRSIATHILTGPVTLNLTYPERSGVIFVDGDVTFGGGYNGAYTVVATGTLTIKVDEGDVTGTPPYTAFISGKQIKLIGDSGGAVDLVLYCHNSSGTGEIYLDPKSSTVFCGSMAADKFTIVSYPGQLHNTLQLTSDMLKQLHMPGTY